MPQQDVRTRVASTGQVKAMMWNSSVAYVLATMLVIFLHESAHTVAGSLQGYQATQFTNEVRFTPEQTTSARAITALAGPLFSLLTGLLAMTFRPFRRHGFARLFWVWAAFLSAEEGFGYFTVAPIITAGDTGAALEALNAPWWSGWVCMAFGIAGLFFLARQFAIRGVRYTRDLFEIRAFCYYPWLIGTAVSVALSAGFLMLTAGTSSDAVFAIIIGSASLGVFAPMAMLFWQKVSTAKEPLELSLPRAGIAAAIGVAVGNLLVLTRGIHFR